MNSDNDSEVDIDDLADHLLRDLDLTEPAKQPLSNTLTQDGTHSSGLTKQGKPTRKQSGANAKFVRFSNDNPNSPPLQQNQPSSLLSNMFFPIDDGINGSGTVIDNKVSQSSNLSKQVDTTIISQPVHQSKQNKKDDWLGLEEDDNDELNFLLKGDKPSVVQQPLANIKKPISSDEIQKKPLDQFDTSNNNDFSLRWTSENNHLSNIKVKEEPIITRKPPPLQINSTSRILSRTPSSELLLEKKSSDTFEDQIMLEEKEETLNNLGILKQNQTQLDNTPRPSSSILDALPFLRQKMQNPPTTGVSEPITKSQSLSPAEFRDRDNTFDGNLNQSALALSGQPKGGVQKKKSVTKGQVVTGNVNTLQLPSHIVNEDELKTMTSSLKTLYTNQLDMLDISYKEQLDFLSLSNKRKEELLKEEIESLHNDYHGRMERLRAEILDNETRFPKVRDEEIIRMSTHFDKLSTQLNTLNGSINRQNAMDLNIQNELKSALVDALSKTLESQLSKVVHTIETSLMRNVKQTLENAISSSSTNTIPKEFQQDLNTKLDDISQKAALESTNILSKIEDLQKSSQLEAENVLRTQKKLKDNVVNSTVSSITKIIETDRQENMRKRDRTGMQIKECRKDLRRLFSELELKNDSVHKSKLNIEMEQRNITQSIRDINTLLKVSTFGKQSNPANHNENVTNQFATAMQAVHQQTQNEMEIKLLREERNSLSESIAQLNIERRKLADERVNLERDKMDFERERTRIRDIEMNAKAAIVDAEDMRRRLEAVNLKEIKLTGEIEMKRGEMVKDMSKMKERIFEIEQKLMFREQKLFQEKAEFIREKEFLDKLRDQLLCPGCLTSVKGGVSSILNLGPPPYYQQHLRSSGDGIEFGVMSSLVPNKINLTPEENAYFINENKYLDELSKKLNN